MRIVFFISLYLTLQVSMLLGMSEETGETAQVIDHSDDLKEALISHDFETSMLLLSKRDSPKIEIHNLVIRPFYELYINWDFSEALRIKVELNDTYGDTVNLAEYDELFEESYSLLKEFEPTDKNRQLGIQALTGNGSGTYEGGMLEVLLLLAKGASISLDNPISKERIEALELQSSTNQIRTIGANEKEVVSNVMDVEIPETLPVQEIVEAVEDSSPPEPTIEDKAAEVVVAEPSEEPGEQSSQWWLWLIGAVVVFGGIGLVLRRKS